MTNDVSTEEKILAAAKKVFMRDGFQGARMDDIAEEADVNKALLHYYFRSKRKLFDIIFEEARSKMLPRAKEIFDSDLPFFEKIKQFIHSYFDLLSENPFLPLFIINEVHKNPQKFAEESGLLDAIRPTMMLFVQNLNEEIERGNVKPIAPTQLLMNIISMCIFSFLGKPMFQMMANMDELQYQLFLQRRREEVARFVIDAIKV
jgi:AcrR family transcriptional regulator